MPCNCDHMNYGYSPDDHKYDRDVYLHKDRDKIMEKRQKLLEKTTGFSYEPGAMINANMLCYVCTRVERGDDWDKILEEYPDLRDWWNNHKKEDVERERQESLNQRYRERRKVALDKLSPEDRAVLGLNDKI